MAKRVSVDADCLERLIRSLAESCPCPFDMDGCSALTVSECVDKLRDALKIEEVKDGDTS